LDTTVDLGAFENTATLSVAALETISFTIAPNPTRGEIHINSQHRVKNVEVYSQIGHKILETKQQSISLANLPSGMYIVKITTSQHQSIVKKVIKK
jgi:hypothetical protein